MMKYADAVRADSQYIFTKNYNTLLGHIKNGDDVDFNNHITHDIKLVSEVMNFVDYRMNNLTEQCELTPSSNLLNIDNKETEKYLDKIESDFIKELKKLYMNQLRNVLDSYNELLGKIDKTADNYHTFAQGMYNRINNVQNTIKSINQFNYIQ